MPLHPGESNWRFVPCGPILQDENGRTIEREGWALPRQKITYFSLSMSRDLPDYTCAERVL